MSEPMTLDLLPTLHVVDDDVSAVIDAYMADPTVGPVAFGEGYRIDPGAAVSGHPFARTLMAEPWAGLDLRRAAVRAAILLARPERIDATATIPVQPVSDRSDARPVVGARRDRPRSPHASARAHR